MKPCLVTSLLSVVVFFVLGGFDSDGVGQAPEPSPPPKDHTRMDDTGCCVLKKSKYKPEWEFHDDIVRRQCITDARGLGVDYDFYKAKKCEQVKKEINDGTAIPN